MKICILSMQDVDNFGSLLQSYSLKKLLLEMRHDVYFISIEPNSLEDSLMNGFKESYSFETGGSSKWRKLKRIDRNSINRLKVKKRNRIQNKLFAEFRKKELGIGEGDQDRKYDYCVIGSDEVFNCKSATKWGFTSQLFGNVRQAEHVITYAASCGATTVEKVPESVRNLIRSSLAKVHAISVRDENTKRFVTELIVKKPEVHLDPVLIGKFDDEMEHALMPEGVPDKYCIVYSYYNRINQKNEISAIKKFCKKKGLQIVSVGAPQMWIHTHVVCNPFQMLNLFRNADFVITDTFHGTIFSSKFTSRFAIFVRKSNKNKLLDLVERLGLQDHLLNHMDELENIYNKRHNKKVFNQQIVLERKKSIDYLKRNIQDNVFN